jgi:hypothetical protein
MDEIRGHASSLQLSNGRESDDERAIASVNKSSADKNCTTVGGKYMAVSPNGSQIAITKELFIALSDFIETRKCPGSISIQFRNGEIICVEAVAKKTYRGT